MTWNISEPTEAVTPAPFCVYYLRSILTCLVVCQVRAIISDFAVFFTILTMVLVDYALGIPSPKLKVPSVFKVGIQCFYIQMAYFGWGRKNIFPRLHVECVVLPNLCFARSKIHNAFLAQQPAGQKKTNKNFHPTALIRNTCGLYDFP